MKSAEPAARGDGTAKELPLPLTCVRERGFRFLVAEEFRDLAEREGWSHPDGFAALDSSGRPAPGGRGPHRLIDPPTAGTALRVRPARRGGLLAPLLGERFLGPGRVLREFRLSLRLAARGVPLATPVFAGSQQRGLFWSSRIASLDRPNALDGLRWLERTHPTPLTLARAGVALAATLRGLHDAGAVHGDLQLRNLLLEPAEGVGDRNEGFSCCLIDLDRARFVAPVSPGLRMREWMRLARSVEKQGFDELLTPFLRSHVLNAYCAGNDHLQREMLRALPRELRRTARHRLGWRVMGGRASGRARRPPEVDSK